MNSRQFNQMAHQLLKHIRKQEQGDQGDQENSDTAEEQNNVIPAASSKANTVASKGDAARREQQKERRENWKFRLEVVGAILVPAAILISAWQGFEARRANFINQQSLEVNQRAFVVFKTPIIENARSVDGPFFEIGGAWENTGSTPAIGIVGDRSADMRDLPPTASDFKVSRKPNVT